MVLSPQPQRRWRRFDAKSLARLATLAHGLPDEILLQTLERLRLTSRRDLLAAAELDPATGAEALTELRRQQASVSYTHLDVYKRQGV